MWKYTHTDEMYHSLVNGKELIHSDVYLGQEYSDGFKHYKYLKKVKSPSGKWRYIYDESELKAEEKKINALKKSRDALRDKDGDYSYVNKDGDSVIKTKDGATITVGSLSANRKQSAKDKAKEKLYYEVDKKDKKHRKQKLKDIPKRVVSRGIGAVNKFLYNTEKKWIK